MAFPGAEFDSYEGEDEERPDVDEEDEDEERPDGDEEIRLEYEREQAGVLTSQEEEDEDMRRQEEADEYA